MELVVLSPTNPPISVMLVIVLAPRKLSPIAFRAFERHFQAPSWIIDGANSGAKSMLPITIAVACKPVHEPFKRAGLVHVRTLVGLMSAFHPLLPRQLSTRFRHLPYFAVPDSRRTAQCGLPTSQRALLSPCGLRSPWQVVTLSMVSSRRPRSVACKKLPCV